MKHLYNSRITIQSVTKTKDAFGSWVYTWADASGLTNLPCRINWLTGFSRGEVIVNSKVSWVRDAKVYCAYYSTITTAMRVVYGDVNYDIVDLGNVDEKSQYMVLTLKKGEVLNGSKFSLVWEGITAYSKHCCFGFT